MSIDENIKQAQTEKCAKSMQSARRQIWVTFRREGIHKYPAALTDPKLNTKDEYDVSFLGYPL